MTREDIEKAYQEQGTRVWMYGDKAVIDFALDAARKAYDECENIAESTPGTVGWFDIVKKIRMAKP